MKLRGLLLLSFVREGDDVTELGEEEVLPQATTVGDVRASTCASEADKRVSKFTKEQDINVPLSERGKREVSLSG